MYVLQVHVIQVRTHIQGAVIKSWSLLANVHRNTIHSVDLSASLQRAEILGEGHYQIVRCL